MFYIQHGYGKSNKIEAVNELGRVAGVILSPTHEDVNALTNTANLCRGLGLRVMLDPQSYIYSTRPQGAARHHATHGIELTSMQWSASAATVGQHLTSVYSANSAISVESPLISSAPFNQNLTDYWIPSSLQYARTATDLWQDTTVLATVAVSQSALSDWNQVADWLDALTTLDVAGFYLVVDRGNQPYPPGPWDPRILANVLRAIHTLACINEYELVWGYADVDGILGIAAGATGVASGWSYGLRQFNVSRYTEDRTGGSTPVPRLYLDRIFADVRNNEATDIFENPVGRELLPPVLPGEFPDGNFESLTNPRAQVQHLVAVSLAVNEIAVSGNIEQRVSLVEERVGIGIEILTRLSQTGLALDPKYLSRLASYREALTLFRGETDL
ncbi:hypothetical protein K875_01169 [Mycobacterium [tuberculosis] TKK-01-0051]|uniref:Uncharacterized protein n=1 Tax=Mycobacterium [tuberculosis] TKK-01-0051 TaxID=1324261 RepID=A0A051UI44_9MYCO|nr:hypothetical protein [Mycobacterium colombiense]KBZ68613.1 hypothetical protein K875_01169 [Mycobacterium [tuberculosis] TKK-01-0051]